MNRAWTGRARPLAGLVAATLTVFTLSLAGMSPASADDGQADHSDGTSATAGDTASPQPESTADQNDGGANGQCPDGPYCSTRDGSPSENGEGDGEAKGKPCAGCVGKADNKNPQGQNPDGSDHNRGYECDDNNGVGKSNPAHTGCAGDEESSAATACQSGTSTSDDSATESEGSDQAEGADESDGADESEGADESDGADGEQAADAGHAKAEHGKSEHAKSGDEQSADDEADQGSCPPCPEQASMSGSGEDGECTAPCPDQASMDQGDEDGECTAPCPDQASMDQGDEDSECAPCPEESSMSGSDASGDTEETDDECAAGTGSTTAPASPAAAPATGAGRPPVVAGVEAFADTPAAGAADVAAADSVLPSAGVLPNTGAGWAVMLAGVLGTALVLFGAVTMRRRRGAQV